MVTTEQQLFIFVHCQPNYSQFQVLYGVSAVQRVVYLGRMETKLRCASTSSIIHRIFAVKQCLVHEGKRYTEYGGRSDVCFKKIIPRIRIIEIDFEIKGAIFEY